MNSEAHVSTLITNLLTIRLRTTLTSAARNRMVFIMLRSSSKLIIVKIIYKKSKTDIGERKVSVWKMEPKRSNDSAHFHLRIFAVRETY